MFVTGFDGQGEYLAAVESHELTVAKGPGGQGEYLATVESHELPSKHITFL